MQTSELLCGFILDAKNPTVKDKSGESGDVEQLAFGFGAG